MKFLSLTVLLIGLQLITIKSKKNRAGGNSITQNADIYQSQKADASVKRRGTAKAVNVAFAGIGQDAEIDD